MSGDTSGRDKRWGDTTSKLGEKARLFVGNTDPKKTVTADLERIFRPYGDIDGIDVNSNGFAFVQFARVEDALRASQHENGTMLYGKKLEMRLFDKSGPKKKGMGGGRERSRSPLGRGGPPGGGHPQPMYDDYGPPGPGPYSQPAMQPPPPPQNQTNDIEIIVMSKDQWAFGELIEKKLRLETGIQFIDLLFLHSPQHINMTLNDLYERRTLYALVIAPLNEEQNTITVHILHNQSEHRNIPVEDAIAVISRDYRAFTGRDRNGPPPHVPPPAPVAPITNDRGPQYDNYRPSSSDGTYPRSGINTAYGTGNVVQSVEKRLPDDINYVLRTTLSEGGCQFLSLSQIDSVIEYFTKERDRLTSAARPIQASFQPQQQGYQQQPQQPGQTSASIGSNQPTASNLLDNPQLKAALTSLFQLGAIGSVASANGSSAASASKDQVSANNDAPSYNTSSAYGQQQYASGNEQQGAAQIRRHPLMGTELGGGGPATSRGPPVGVQRGYPGGRY